jgi:predicted RNA binding protein YcfA (HicA-like mRNA interferase family)
MNISKNLIPFELKKPMITDLKKIEKKLKKLGYTPRNHTNSHTVFIKKGSNNVVIPKQKKRDLIKPVYFSIIKQTGLTVQQFENL